MLIRAFENVDHYTLMSLSDVITQACSCFKEESFELAQRVAPILAKFYLTTSAEDQIHSMFSLIGKFVTFAT